MLIIIYDSTVSGPNCETTVVTDASFVSEHRVIKLIYRFILSAVQQTITSYNKVQGLPQSTAFSTFLDKNFNDYYLFRFMALPKLY